MELIMQDTNITTADYFDAMRTTEAFLPSLRSLDISLLPAAVQAIARLIGLPATLREVGVSERSQLKEIADSCGISAGSYKKMTHEEILEILNECYE